MPKIQNQVGMAVASASFPTAICLKLGASPLSRGRLCCPTAGNAGFVRKCGPQCVHVSIGVQQSRFAEGSGMLKHDRKSAENSGHVTTSSRSVLPR
jgi:hypothetical protein